MLTSRGTHPSLEPWKFPRHKSCIRAKPRGRHRIVAVSNPVCMTAALLGLSRSSNFAYVLYVESFPATIPPIPYWLKATKTYWATSVSHIFFSSSQGVFLLFIHQSSSFCRHYYHDADDHRHQHSISSVLNSPTSFLWYQHTPIPGLAFANNVRFPLKGS